MVQKYEIGSRVVIRPVGNQSPGVPNPAIASYAGRIGEVTDYYWITPRPGEVFYMYSVRPDDANDKEIVLHEDEIESY